MKSGLAPLRPAHMQAAAWLVLAAVLGTGALACWQNPALPAAAWLDWQPARLASEPWRAFTAAFVHGSAPHLAANLGALMAVAAFGWAARLPAAAALAWLVAWPLTHLGLLARPDLLFYGGLSGVLHAGVAVAALWLAVQSRGARRVVALATLAGLGVKLLSEQPWGPTLVADGTLTVSPWAHAAGALAGLVCTTAVLAWRHTRRR
jgi:rhomboid family GlyGly-CTERM serine protease